MHSGRTHTKFRSLREEMDARIGLEALRNAACVTMQKEHDSVRAEELKVEQNYGFVKRMVFSLEGMKSTKADDISTRADLMGSEATLMPHCTTQTTIADMATAVHKVDGVVRATEAEIQVVMHQSTQTMGSIGVDNVAQTTMADMVVSMHKGTQTMEGTRVSQVAQSTITDMELTIDRGTQTVESANMDHAAQTTMADMEITIHEFGRGAEATMQAMEATAHQGNQTQLVTKVDSANAALNAQIPMVTSWMVHEVAGLAIRIWAADVISQALCCFCCLYYTMLYHADWDSL